MIRFAGYAAWAAAADALIPVMAVLSARLGRAMGDPIRATMPLFLVGLLAASGVAFILTGRTPNLQSLEGARAIDFAGGLIMAGYVISVTLIAPRFGIGNVILFAVTAQILTSAAIDHFGLFETASRPLNGLRLTGIAMILTGLAVAQIAVGGGSVRQE